MNKNTKCIFCTLNVERIIHENEYAVAIRDGYPVTNLHQLVIPRRHVSDYLELTEDEILGCHGLLNVLKRDIFLLDPTVKGFNVGGNCNARLKVYSSDRGLLRLLTIRRKMAQGSKLNFYNISGNFFKSEQNIQYRIYPQDQLRGTLIYNVVH